MSEQSLQAVAFPKLNESQLASLASCPLTKTRRLHVGETLFECGQRGYNFYVVKSGQVVILDESGEQPKIVTVHEPGAFTGEVNQLTGSPALVRAVAQGETEVYEISPEALQLLLNHHPDLGDLILTAFIARRQLLRESGTFTGLRVIGSRFSPDTFRIREFLAKNHVPFTWIDVESDPAVRQLLAHFAVTEAETPVVGWGNKLLLRNPSNRELAETIGLRQPIERTVYDLVVVGAGPAGLAAAVYAASEGLSTVVLERTAPGGQAGRSMRIENYLGFPAGISGSELSERATVQAMKFGARMLISSQAMRLTFDSIYPVLHLDDDEQITAKCLLIATGADYRLLNIKGCEHFEGCGVYYAATPLEAQVCRNADVVVVGGGNSAGQAAVYLADVARKVYLVVRGDSLYKNMSSYIAQRIEQNPKIEVLLNSEIQELTGDGQLSDVELVNRKTGESLKLKCPAVFSFIGAVPRSDWLPPEIERDAKQFVLTGPTLVQSQQWKIPRQPFLLETSRPGIFAVGDVRSGSVKRVASAVGEGSMAVQFVHEYLRER